MDSVEWPWGERYQAALRNLSFQTIMDCLLPEISGENATAAESTVASCGAPNARSVLEPVGLASEHGLAIDHDLANGIEVATYRLIER